MGNEKLQTGKEIIAEVHKVKNEREKIEKVIKQNKRFKFWAFAVLFIALGFLGGTYSGVQLEKYMTSEKTQAVQSALKAQTPQE